jgi:hypothetical protein
MGTTLQLAMQEAEPVPSALYKSSVKIARTIYIISSSRVIVTKLVILCCQASYMYKLVRVACMKGNDGFGGGN